MDITKWDKRFLELSKLVASWSKDPSTQTGAVIVRPDRTILAVGYNGFPKGMEDYPELYANRDVKYSRIVHCEMNAVLNAKQSVQGCTLYTWPFASCDRCAVHMIQAGITTFVFPKLPKELEARWQASVDKTLLYFTEARVDYREI
jgi:dCMP deaminase